MSLYGVTAFSLNYDGPIRNLCLISEDGYLRYEERVVTSSTAKFGFEDSKNGRGVHFRSLQNNKYLVRRRGTNWISATSKEAVEDVSSQDSTLFRVEIVNGSTMRWVYLASGTETVVGIAAPDHPTNSYYLSVAPGTSNRVACTPVDVERIVKLPDTVVFKGDNDKYMHVHQDDQSLSFIGEDRNRKEAWLSIVPLNNGDKSVKTGMFWCRQQNGDIQATVSNPTSTDPNTMFQVATLSDSSIALVNRGNTTTSLFCQRTSDSLFKADVDTGVKEAGLVVEEPVVSSNVEVEYRLDDARIYDVQPRSWLSQIASNTATEGDLQTTLSIAYSEALSSTFTNTNSETTNVTSTTSISASIPFITEAKTELAFSYGKTVEASFGKTIEKTETMNFSATVIVPPGQSRGARILANEAKCDVPFSYVLTQLSSDNVITRTKLEDGVYKGMNGYDFHVQVYDPNTPDQPELHMPLIPRNLPHTLARKQVYLKKDLYIVARYISIYVPINYYPERYDDRASFLFPQYFSLSIISPFV